MLNTNTVQTNKNLVHEKTLYPRGHWFALFLLAFMSGQYVLLEGSFLSWPKMIVMALAPIIVTACGISPFSKGMIFGGLYWITICITSYIHPYAVNHMSLLFTVPFILMFGSYLALLEKNVFSIEEFEKLLLYVMYAYIIFLLLQQVCYFVGIHHIVLFNRWRPLGFKFQSLGLEPSFAARIFGAYAFAYLEILRLKHGKNLSISFLLKEYRRPMLGIIYFFVTLGSGTGWGCLGFLGMYVAWHGQPALALILLGGIFLIPDDQIEAKDRLIRTTSAAMTLDPEKVLEADQSAAFRVNAFFSIIPGFRPDTEIFWFGQGAYQWIQPNIGIIMLYGFIGWLAQITLFLVCSFRRLFSFEFLYFCVFLAMGIGNVVNQWAILMLFATLKHFYEQKKNVHAIKTK